MVNVRECQGIVSLNVFLLSYLKAIEESAISNQSNNDQT